MIYSAVLVFAIFYLIYAYNNALKDSITQRMLHGEQPNMKVSQKQSFSACTEVGIPGHADKHLLEVRSLYRDKIVDQWNAKERRWVTIGQTTDPTCTSNEAV